MAYKKAKGGGVPIRGTNETHLSGAKSGRIDPVADNNGDAMLGGDDLRLGAGHSAGLRGPQTDDTVKPRPALPDTPEQDNVIYNSAIPQTFFITTTAGTYCPDSQEQMDERGMVYLPECGDTAQRCCDDARRGPCKYTWVINSKIMRLLLRKYPNKKYGNLVVTDEYMRKSIILACIKIHRDTGHIIKYPANHRLGVSDLNCTAAPGVLELLGSGITIRAKKDLCGAEEIGDPSNWDFTTTGASFWADDSAWTWTEGSALDNTLKCIAQLKENTHAEMGVPKCETELGGKYDPKTGVQNLWTIVEPSTMIFPFDGTSYTGGDCWYATRIDSVVAAQNDDGVLTDVTVEWSWAKKCGDTPCPTTEGVSDGLTWTSGESWSASDADPYVLHRGNCQSYRPRPGHGQIIKDMDAGLQVVFYIRYKNGLVWANAFLEDFLNYKESVSPMPYEVGMVMVRKPRLGRWINMDGYNEDRCKGGTGEGGLDPCSCPISYQEFFTEVCKVGGKDKICENICCYTKGFPTDTVYADGSWADAATKHGEVKKVACVCNSGAEEDGGCGCGNTGTSDSAPTISLEANETMMGMPGMKIHLTWTCTEQDKVHIKIQYSTADNITDQNSGTTVYEIEEGGADWEDGTTGQGYHNPPQGTNAHYAAFVKDRNGTWSTVDAAAKDKIINVTE